MTDLPSADQLDTLAINFVKNGGLENVPVIHLAMSVLSAFAPLEEYDVVQNLSFPAKGMWGAYISAKEKIGCILVEDFDVIPLVAFADFATNRQIIVERDFKGGNPVVRIADLKEPGLKNMKPFFNFE